MTKQEKIIVDAFTMGFIQCMTGTTNHSKAAIQQWAKYAKEPAIKYLKQYPKNGKL